MFTDPTLLATAALVLVVCALAYLLR